MPSRIRQAARALLALTLALAAALAPPSAEAQPAPDGRAEAVLRASCAALSGLSAYGFTAQVDRALAWPSGDSARASQVVKALVVRPDRFRVEVAGDDRDQTVVCDGKTLTVLDVDANVYGTVEAQASIDDTVRDVLARYGLHSPLANLLYNDPCRGVAEWGPKARYLGLHMAAGRSCHHLLVLGEDMNWELWIDQEDALTRKLVVTDKTLPGWPQYEAVITSWNTSAKIPAKAFAFVPPKDARKVPVLPVSEPQPAN
ncbi:hypothetical protein NNJEOMEG_01564 [Fundidesulfovibrio magnetotacticus]|uniref:Periplasmic protein n=1 Tax=Fundidesulfovibrio magnetotacticus TaxID=2730080 RepID=A0A6V8LRX5_9BACT|nr:DUF2092 domain-containing protein [Fundidesulfovibrio magnetotacticus]GFK93730.1 hypothetical protein NNJEOMEG_01564 [Fundidesulfovibrio magnetotacticus]